MKTVVIPRRELLDALLQTDERINFDIDPGRRLNELISKLCNQRNTEDRFYYYSYIINLLAGEFQAYRAALNICELAIKDAANIDQVTDSSQLMLRRILVVYSLYFNIAEALHYPVNSEHENQLMLYAKNALSLYEKLNNKSCKDMEKIAALFALLGELYACRQDFPCAEFYIARAVNFCGKSLRIQKIKENVINDEDCLCKFLFIARNISSIADYQQRQGKYNEAYQSYAIACWYLDKIPVGSRYAMAVLQLEKHCRAQKNTLIQILSRNACCCNEAFFNSVSAVTDRTCSRLSTITTIYVRP